MKTLYVSSTDWDMAGERELLHRQVIPAIGKAALEYGETVELCDLRRNPQSKSDPAEQHIGQLLSVCLDEIDRCSPYMIVLVGQHYGAFLGETLRQRIQAHWPDMNPEQEISLTALEILYGALSRKERQDKILFYFRQIEGEVPEFCRPESPRHEQALEELKEKIRTWAGDRVKTYTLRWDEESGGFSGLDGFAAMVEEDMKTLLQQQWVSATKRDCWSKDLQSQWEAVHRQAREFTCRNDLVSQCIRTMEQGNKPLYLSAPAGSGKSTLLSKLAQEFERRGQQVLPVFCGFSSLYRSAVNILQYLTHFTEELLENPGAAQEPQTLAQWQTRLTDALNRYSQEREEELVILLADLDRLTDGKDGAFLPETLPERVRMAVSCTPEVQVSLSDSSITIEPLTEAGVTEMAQGILRVLKLELSQPVLTALTKRPECRNPLYLRLALHRLTMTDLDSGKPAHTAPQQLRLIDRSPADATGLYLEILGDATRILGDPVAVHAGAFLAVARYGLREKDLEAIFQRMGQPWNPVSFARFRKLMGSLLFRRGDGRLDYRYNSLRLTLLERLQERRVFHRAILAHLLTLSAGDPLRDGETVWQALNAQDFTNYVNYIQSPDIQTVALQEAARDTVALLLSAGRDWLMNLLNRGQGCGPEFFAFLDEPLAAALGEDPQALRLHRDILLTTVKTAEQRAQQLGDEEAWREVTTCRNRAGRACYRLGDGESLALVAAMQEQQLHIAESLLTRENTPAQRRKLMAAYEEVAGLYRKQGPAGKEKALALEEKRLNQWQILTQQEEDPAELSALAQAWEDCAKVWAESDNPLDWEKTRDFRGRAMGVRQRLAQLTGDPADYHRVLQDLLPLVRAKGENPERRGQMLELLEKTRDWYLALEEPTAEAREDLARIWFCLGELQSKSHQRENLLRALEMYQESFLLYRALTKVIPTAEIRMDQASCYERMGEIYGNLGGAENLHRALELLNRSLTLRRKLHAKLDTAQTALALALALHRMGRLCAAFGGEGNLLQARRILESALPLHQRVEQENTAPETHKEMIDLRCAIAEIDADLAEFEAQRQREDEERRRAQKRLEEEERAMEQGIKAESDELEDN